MILHLHRFRKKATAVFFFITLTNYFIHCFVIFDMNHPENSFYYETRNFSPNILLHH